MAALPQPTAPQRLPAGRTANGQRVAGWRALVCVPLRRAVLIRSPQIPPSMTLFAAQVARETARQRVAPTQRGARGPGNGWR